MLVILTSHLLNYHQLADSESYNVAVDFEKEIKREQHSVSAYQFFGIFPPKTGTLEAMDNWGWKLKPEKRRQKNLGTEGVCMDGMHSGRTLTVKAKEFEFYQIHTHVHTCIYTHTRPMHKPGQ